MYPGRHMSKSHPEQWTVREVAERPDRSLVTALREFATTQIADCGGPVAIVGPPLRHLAGGAQLCGPAVTVWTKPGDILYVLKATDLIAPGDVLVVDGGSRPDAAVIGDIAGQALADLGCDGLVVDGAVRDLDAGSRTAASSASHTPSANRPATSRATSPASRVLPDPPGPVTVTSRYSSSRPATSATAPARPTKPVSADANLCTPPAAAPAAD